MTALPTLAREWASLGAPHAPSDNVPSDSPRVAAALNTFASYVNESRQVYMSVRARRTRADSRPRPAAGESMCSGGATSSCSASRLTMSRAATMYG